MNIRFAIKNTAGKAEKEGDQIVRYSGVAEPFNRVSQRYCEPVGERQDGSKVLSFVTGLDVKKVPFYKWYSEAEKEQVVKQIEELKPIISDYYGGEEVIDQRNKFFWLDNRDVARLSLTNDVIDTFYDTRNPSHALLYLSIIGGAFSELVAPTKEWAERYQVPHYLVLETEDEQSDDDEITKSDAHAALAELRKEGTPEALFVLAWCLQYDTKAYGAYQKSTPLKDLISYHIKYIDGKLVSKKKRNMPKTFLDYYEKWKKQQTRPALYAEAYIKAGEYYSFIVSKEKRFTLVDGSPLGNTVEEAVTNIMKPKYREDLDKLRDLVEKKWNEQ